MEQRILGRTGINVSAICLGTMTWGLQNTEADGHEQMDYALAHGVTFFDTAEMYAIPASAETYGKTETIIGTWFAQDRSRRDKVVLASKVAGPGRSYVRNGKRPDAKDMRKALEDSLTRLQTDFLDLYQYHWAARPHYHFQGGWKFDPFAVDADRERDYLHEVLEIMGAFVKEGKIRAFGVSNESAWGIMHYLELARAHGLPRVASVQNEYNLIRREYDHDLAELTRYEDVGLLAYSPIAAGVLSGKYLNGAMPKGTRGDISGGMYRASEFTEAAVNAYIGLAHQHGLDPVQMALAFCLSRPFMTSVIIGATSMAHLQTNIDAANVTLSDEVLDGIEKIHRRYPNPI